MRRVTGALAITLLAPALVLSVPSPARAASSQVGNTCTASVPVPDTTLVMTGGAPSNPIPSVFPSAGVVTKATFTLPATPSVYPQRVKILRAAGPVNTYSVVAQSGLVGVTGGVSSFAVRMPVAAGDLLGMYGTAGSLGCSTPNATDTVATVAGDEGVGTTGTYSPATTVALPLVVTVEPDADHDGFGDLSQDLCPQLATAQSACPPVTLDSLAAARGQSIAVVVASDTKTAVTVGGTAKVQGRKITFPASTKTVTPGVLAQFVVKLPKPLKVALAALASTKSIKVSVTATATNAAGQVATDTSVVKLHGTHR